MGRQWPAESVPTSKTLPVGRMVFHIDEIEERMSAARDGKLSKLGYAVSLTVAEPTSLIGRKHSEYYNIGTETDPMAKDPNTWNRSFGAIDLNLLLKASKANVTNDIDNTIASAKGNRVGATLVHKPRRDDKTQMDARVSLWWPEGTQEVWVDGDDDVFEPPVKLVKRPLPAPVDDSDDEAEAPTPVAAAKPKAKTGVPPGIPSGDPGDTTKSVTAKKVTKTDQKTCPKCQKTMPRGEFLDHLESHDEDDDEEE